MRLLMTCDLPTSFVRYTDERALTSWPLGDRDRYRELDDQSCRGCGFHQCECVEQLTDFVEVVGGVQISWAQKELMRQQQDREAVTRRHYDHFIPDDVVLPPAAQSVGKAVNMDEIQRQLTSAFLGVDMAVGKSERVTATEVRELERVPSIGDTGALCAKGVFGNHRLQYQYDCLGYKCLDCGEALSDEGCLRGIKMTTKCFGLWTAVQASEAQEMTAMQQNLLDHRDAVNAEIEKANIAKAQAFADRFGYDVSGRGLVGRG